MSEARPLPTIIIAFIATLLPTTFAPASLTLSGAVSWDGSCGGSNWLATCSGGTLTNWNDDNIPTLGSIVSIPQGSPIVSVTGNAAAGTISCQSGLSITSGGALQLANGGTIAGLNINTISLFGIRVDAGTLTLEQGANWQFGRVTGNGTVHNNALVVGRTLELGGTTQFENFDVVELSFLINNTGCTFTNIAGSMLNMTVPAGHSQTSISGNGTFFNNGELRFTYTGAPHTIDLACPYQQLDGSLTVTGDSQGNGTRLENDTTFTGGHILLSNAGTLQFRNDGGNATHVIDGLESIAGNGTAIISMLGTAGSDDFRIDGDVTVNLTGNGGLVLTSAEPLTLNAVLHNTGNFTWSGGTIQHGDCAACEPELRNEGQIDIFTSGALLNTWIRNLAGGTITHENGSLNLGDQGVITNHGTYTHHRGTLQRAGGTSNGSFTNYNLYHRPAVEQTNDVTVTLPFTLNPGSEARYEKAYTDYSIGGLHFNGGNATITSPAVVRVSNSSVEAQAATISGSGQFHIGGLGISTFIVEQADAECAMNLGTLLGLPNPDAGMYLTTGGRIGGPGTVINNRRCIWQNAGQVGSAGQGRLVNWGVVMLTGGNVGGVQAMFINEGVDFDDFGEVFQSGTLTINTGLAVNRGMWHVTAPTTIQGFGAHEFVNDGGLFRSNPGAGQTVSVNAAFNNAGEVRVDSGTLQFSGPVAQVSAGGVGGHWTIVNGATLNLPGTITIVKPDGKIIVNGTWSDLDVVHTNQGWMSLGAGNLTNGFVNEGTLEVVPGAGPVTVQGGAGAASNGATGKTDQKTSGQFARGGERGGAGGGAPIGLMCSTFTNHGTVRPGGFDLPGAFSIDGNFVQSATGTLAIELDGAMAVDQHDQLIVDGDVSLDGTLHVRMLPGFVPAIGQQFTIIAAANGTISGAFDQIIGYGQYTVAYAPDSVTLTVVTPPEPGDINGDGQVNVLDLLAVVNGWGLCPAQPPFCAADLNGDGAVTVLDLLMVINFWD